MATAKKKPVQKAAAVAPKAVKAVNKPLGKEFNCPARLSGLKFGLGEKKYSPRVEHTIAAWEKVSGALPAKGEKLAELLKQHATRPDEDHYDFIFYLQRRGALRIVE